MKSHSVEAGSHVKSHDLHFEGLSLSGIRTALSIPELGISFDVAQGYPFTLKMKKFFITHGHLDHAAGIPYIISQKALLNEAGPVFYVPPSLEEPLREMMRIWEKIEKHQYRFQLHSVQHGQVIELNPQYFIKPFTTVHRIESFGYTLFSRNKKLRKEFIGRPGNEIAALKQSGVQIEDWIEVPVVSFTGDTQIEFLDQGDWVRDSKILFCETTYLDNRKSVQQARQWGHTHLDELISRLDQINSDKIYLIHLSSRYTSQEALKIIREKVPQKHLHRIEIFPGR